MAGERFWRRKALLAKLETTYGVDPTMTGAANAILASDIRLSPMEGQDIERNLDLPWFGNDGTIPAGLHAKIAFKVELAPSGTAGTAPAWAPLIRACGASQTIVAATSVTYAPVSTGFESVAISLNIDGQSQTLLGCRGTFKLTIGAEQIPYLEFEFTGLFAAPAEVALPTPTLTAFQMPLAAGAVNTPTFTIGGTSLQMSSFMFDLGNQVEPRFLVGGRDILITDRAEKVETKVNAVALTTLNPWSLAAARSTVAVNLQHGTAAGARATLAIPVAQVMRTTALEMSQNVLEWPLNLMPRPNAGNDQWSLALT